MKPPKIKFRKPDPLQDYYVDDDGNRYSVVKLIDDAKDLPVFDCPLASLNLSDQIWEGCNIFDLAFHVKKVVDADLDYPILLDWNGCLADGRHRIIKALVDGKRTIKAKRITWRVSPCIPGGD